MIRPAVIRRAQLLSYSRPKPLDHQGLVTAMEPHPGPVPPRILLVSSDNGLTQAMGHDLQLAGYEAVAATSGVECGLALEHWQPALLVIDSVVGKSSGLDLCQELRQQGVTAPLLIIMSSDGVEERVACLVAGADDYILTPYNPKSFLELVQFYLQPSQDTSEQLRFDNLTLDLGTRRAERNGRTIELTMKEYELLKYLMEHPRQILSRDQILENVWGYDFMGESNVIEVYVRYLRIKIEDDNDKRLIHTVRGVGYVLREA